MTASPDALDHAQGLLAAVSPAGRVDRHGEAQVGARWRLVEQGLAIKRYPVCFSAHRTLDGLIALAAKHDLRADQVQRVRISMSARNAGILRNHRPSSGAQARFSAEFAAACALIARRLTTRELADDFVRRRDVRELIARVDVISDPREDPVTGYAPYDEITVEMTSGEVLSTRVDAIRGSLELPMTETELFEKFAGLLASAAAGFDSRRLFDRLSALDQIADCRRFVEEIAAALADGARPRPVHAGP
jgi:2-methylcitrate dehydratase PrpD